MIIDVQELKNSKRKSNEYFFQQKLGKLEYTDMLSRKEDELNPVNVKVYAFFADAKVYISGNLKSWITSYCSRCLASFKQEVKGEFWEEFKVNPHLAHEEDDGDLLNAWRAANTLEIKGGLLDLSEYIRQLFIVFQEWKPLCHSDCRGICSLCGVNLNEASCSCGWENIDPRLAPLKKLQSGNEIRRN